MGTNKCVKNRPSVKVATMLRTPKQRCDIIQDVCYNVPVMNQFENLDIQEKSHINTCDNLVNNVRCNVQKAHKVCTNKSRSVVDKGKTLDSFKTNSEGECVNCLLTDDNSNIVNSLVNQATSNECLGNDQIKLDSNIDTPDLKLVDCENSIRTKVVTILNLSREIPCQVVQQDLTGSQKKYLYGIANLLNK